MTLYYSKSERSFYDPDIHGDAIPKDKVEITKEYHIELLEGQSNGKVITPNKKGYPILIDRVPTPDEEIQEHNAAIISAIETLEREQQPRVMREFLLDGDKTNLEALNKKIVELRNQLIK